MVAVVILFTKQREESMIMETFLTFQVLYLRLFFFKEHWTTMQGNPDLSLYPLLVHQCQREASFVICKVHI